MKKLLLLFNTVKFLKPIQVYYRLYYFARKRVRRLTGFQYPLSVASRSIPLKLMPSIPSHTSLDENTFTFLNLSHTFENGIDWNFSEFGKLWTYNLSYFDYLQQEGMTKEKGLELIEDFIAKMESHKDALEPFPISLRGINWIKFMTQHQIKDQKIDDSLYAQYKMLMDNLEYHLLGNHLLENGFSLLFGACYFQDETLYAKAAEILKQEIDEQILDDGAHFELSPMYHQIILFRVLDCLNLVKRNSLVVKGDGLESMLEEKVAAMLGWLEAITFEDGSIPLFNDSATGIAPTPGQLDEYATNLNSKFKIQNSKLTSCGYRKFKTPNYECVIDIGPIGPDYIPGHAHADTFNFELHITQSSSNHQPSTINHQPFITDTGLSTYETDERRMTERGTAAHNTVEVNGTDSSEVWGGFRVADRATVTIEEENDTKIVASHDGYQKKFGIIHTREWIFEEERIIIKDSLNKPARAVARLHFHPEVTEKMIHEHITILTRPSTIHHPPSTIHQYKYAPAFNTLVDALVLEIPFEKELTVIICLKSYNLK